MTIVRQPEPRCGDHRHDDAGNGMHARRQRVASKAEQPRRDGHPSAASKAKPFLPIIERSDGCDGEHRDKGAGERRVLCRRRLACEAKQPGRDQQDSADDKVDDIWKVLLSPRQSHGFTSFIRAFTSKLQAELISNLNSNRRLPRQSNEQE